ncbi:uncharacterized protein UDID_17228 [Ustilago sp. UG-2017a]|nr:uncharacterized protein UDID_17228 [Ustilago sp. UG-2017a]
MNERDLKATVNTTVLQRRKYVEHTTNAGSATAQRSNQRESKLGAERRSRLKKQTKERSLVWGKAKASEGWQASNSKRHLFAPFDNINRSNRNRLVTGLYSKKRD